MKLNKYEIEIIRDGLEIQIDSDTDCLNSWKEDNSGILKKVYGKDYKVVINCMKKDLEKAHQLDKKLWKELQKFKKS